MRQAQATNWSVHRHTWHHPGFRLLAPCDGDVSYSQRPLSIGNSLPALGATIEALQTRAKAVTHSSLLYSRSRLRLLPLPARAVRAAWEIHLALGLGLIDCELRTITFAMADDTPLASLSLTHVYYVSKPYKQPTN